MVLVWDDAKSFNQHLEAMSLFRRSHRALEPGRLPYNDSLLIHDIGISRGKVNPFTHTPHKMALVAIWKIAAPAGSRN